MSSTNDPQQSPSPEPSQAPAQAPPPGGWAWAAPVVMETRETVPLEYHRLYHGAQGFRWWRALLALLIAIGIYLGFALVVGIVFGAVLSFTDPAYVLALAEGEAEALDTQQPVTVLMGLFSIALMIPAVLLAMRSMGIRPTGRVWSVATRIRWRLLLRATGIAVVAVVAMNLAGMGFEILLDPSMLSEPPELVAESDFDARAALLSFIFVIFLVPFQAAAEEVAFRGFLMQVIGSWLRSTWFWILLAIAVPLFVLGIFLVSGVEGLIEQGTSTLIVAVAIVVIAAALRRWTGSPFIAIALPTLLFAVMHLYDVWGMLVVSLMGLVAAWLTWRTGGLEAAIAIHVINNLVAFGFMSMGFGGETAQTEGDAGPGSLVGEIVGLVLFTWLVLRSFRSGRYGRTRIDLIQVPVPAPQVAPAVPAMPQPGAPNSVHEPDVPQAPKTPQDPQTDQDPEAHE